MSTLIDNLISLKNTNQEIEGKWYIAKPYEPSNFPALVNRIKDAYRILIGKSRAYHFCEDEINDIVHKCK